MTASFQRFGARYGLVSAFGLALIATLVSLYMSEGAHWPPCKLCWLQRAFMFPLVFLLGKAALQRHRFMVKYTLPLTLVGGLVSLFHGLQQHIPALAEVAACKKGAVSCSDDKLATLTALPWLSIPFLTLLVFLAISFCLWLARERG